MKSKTRVIAFANNKGGSAKTTTCVNLAYCLSVLGRRVLVIDGDMQLNLSLSFFGEEEVLAMSAGKKNLYQAILEQTDLREDIVHTPYDGLDLVPSSLLMSGIEYQVFSRERREYLLRECLRGVRESGFYDYILIDSPPTIGGWVMNILCAADEVVVPVEASPWGLFGLANMFEFLDSAREFNEDLRLLGVAVTKLDLRKGYSKQTLKTIREFADIPVFHQIIRIDSEIEWAQDNSKPVMAHRKSARSAEEYMELAKEVDGYAGRDRQFAAGRGKGF